MSKQFDVAVSLGPTCRAAYQLRRIFGPDVCPSGVFDWQITPSKSLRRYLKFDFAGAFERDDLEINRKSEAFNRVFRTRHRHEFPHPCTDRDLVEHFETARSRHDYLAEKTRSLLRSGDKDLLLCLSRPISALSYVRLNYALRHRYPSLRFTLLNGPRSDLSEGAETWKGSDELWDRHLSGFSPNVGASTPMSPRLPI